MTCSELAQWIAHLSTIPGFKDEARRWYLELMKDTSGQWLELEREVKKAIEDLEHDQKNRPQPHQDS